jgi:hypothetical protein
MHLKNVSIIHGTLKTDTGGSAILCRPDYSLAYGYKFSDNNSSVTCKQCLKKINKSLPLKLYILVKESMLQKDFGHTILSIAHAMAAGSRNWTGDPVFEDWANNSFRKVLCKVTDEQFEKAKTYFPEDEFQVMTECAIDDQELTIVFKPREEWPKFFSFLSLLK